MKNIHSFLEQFSFLSSKAIEEADLPVKFLKGFFAASKTKCFNDTFKSAKFPNCLKLASITPVFKKNARTSKSIFRLVNVLCCMSFFKYLNALFATHFQHFFRHSFKV